MLQLQDIKSSLPTHQDEGSIKTVHLTNPVWRQNLYGQSLVKQYQYKKVDVMQCTIARFISCKGIQVPSFWDSGSKALWLVIL